MTGPEDKSLRRKMPVGWFGDLYNMRDIATKHVLYISKLSRVNVVFSP